MFIHSTRFTLVLRVQLTKLSIWVTKKSSTFTCVVWAGDSKTGLWIKSDLNGKIYDDVPLCNWRTIQLYSPTWMLHQNPVNMYSPAWILICIFNLAIIKIILRSNSYACLHIFSKLLCLNWVHCFQSLPYICVQCVEIDLIAKCHSFRLQRFKTATFSISFVFPSAFRLVIWRAIVKI